MTRETLPQDARQMAEAALALGAAHAVPFVTDDIVFDSRVRLKCMFGCDQWGKGLTCPSRPGSPTQAEYREMLTRYRWGLIIHAHDPHVSQTVSLAMEQHGFQRGYYFIFSLSDCCLCDVCAGHTGEACRHPRLARPPLHSVGIDVFKTVQQLGLPIGTLIAPDARSRTGIQRYLWTEAP